MRRINEISEDVENIDVSEQLTTLENKFTNKLKEYVNKNELVRDDAIDIYQKVNNENHVLLFEFEDNIVNGLIVFKIFAVNGSNERQRRFYIKIADGVIVDYKGIQEETIIDGITITPLARCEDDRVVYMPKAKLIFDSSEKLILISINSNDLITDAAIEKCIEALDKKINILAEQSHVNDVAIYNIYTTVDEANEVLGNYVLKSDLLPAVNLATITLLYQYNSGNNYLKHLLIFYFIFSMNANQKLQFIQELELSDLSIQ